MRYIVVIGGIRFDKNFELSLQFDRSRSINETWSDFRAIKNDGDGPGVNDIKATEHLKFVLQSTNGGQGNHEIILQGMDRLHVLSSMVCKINFYGLT